MNEWLDRHRMVVLTVVGLLIAGGLGAVWLQWSAPTEIVINPPAPTATAGPIEVYVSGAVIRAGVYVLPPDANVQDALNAAGGAASDADLVAINLAAGVRDGDQVHVPTVGEVVSAPPVQLSGGTGGASAPVSAGGLVNINTATAAELEALPEIGPALAQRIIDYREANGAFTTIEAIQNVSGIGPATFETIKDLITVQ